ADELDNAPNPFLDYRLQVTFTGPSGQQYVAPGFFDGDGAGSGAGNIWKAHFTPDEAGQWQYTASFRRGTNLAIDLNPNAGVAAEFDGDTGFIEVSAPDPNAPDFWQWGRLEYAGAHYLKFRDGSYWIKGGADSPENFLAYSGFNNTIPSHHYAAHLAHWQEGDPDWGDGRGKAIIGALNYLAAQHVNSIYFLPMNIGGDGQDTWPFAGAMIVEGSADNDNLHFDIGKLNQWEIVFNHAQQKGIVLHVVLNEAEEPNKLELDEATLGVERKLFYRELIARFAHHNALIWNLSEEYNAILPLEPETMQEWATYIRAVDPYDHPITLHNNQGGEPAIILPQTAFQDFLGDDRFDLLSVQFRPDQYDLLDASYGEMVSLLREASEEAGRPLPIFMDEPDRVKPVDNETHKENFPMLSGISFIRKAVLWPVYLSGGGIEFILQDMLETEDYGRYQSLWQYTWHARKFMEENLPFWEMEPADELLSEEAVYHLEGGQALAQAGQIYAVYLPVAEDSAVLDLSGINGRFQQRWYNPRTGQFEGELQILEAGDWVNLGLPPNQPKNDWVILLENSDAD
ncbi:MAG: DUF5060 domain-containing protein, partial [Chloroflexi bacterium]|nr:DUF5060 domain-containing protein [Chloroflexota bacterium]